MGRAALGKLLIQPLGLNALWPFTRREKDARVEVWKDLRGKCEWCNAVSDKKRR